MALGVGGAAPDSVDVSGRIAFLTGVDLNTATTDHVMTMDPHVSGRYYIIDYVVFTNPSVSLTTATAGVFSAAAGSGTIIANGALAALVGIRDTLSAFVASASTVTGVISKAYTSLATAPIFRVGTAQGAPATCDVFVFGRVMPDL